MLREMSYSSLPQDETSSSFITQGLMEYSPRSTGSNQKVVCFIVSFLLLIGASLAIIIPLLLDGPSSSGEGSDGVPLSSQLNADQGLSIISNIFNGGVQNETNRDNSDHKDALTSTSDEHQNDTEMFKYTTRVEEATGNPNDDLTWKVVNTGDNVYIVPVDNDTNNNNTQNNNTQSNNTNNTQTNNYNDYTTHDKDNYELLNNMTIDNTLVNNTIINGTFIVNDTESRNTSGLGVMNVTTVSSVQLNATVTIGAHGQGNGTTDPLKVQVTTQPQQRRTTKPVKESVTNYIAPEDIQDHNGSPWQQYENNSYSDTQKTSVISSLDNMTLVVLVALIAVSLSTLVAAAAFLVHVKLETRKRRRNIANVITDLQSPDKIILLNSDESENSEQSDEEYQRS